MSSKRRFLLKNKSKARHLKRFILVLALNFSFSLGLAESQSVQEMQQPDAGTGTITMDLKGVNILDVFDFFSKESGLNIVVGQGVAGQITLFLKDVSVQSALETVLEVANLAMFEDRGLIRIVNQQDYTTRFGRPYKDRSLLRSFPLRYGQADKIAPLLEAFKTRTGKIMVDVRSNTISVLDAPEVVQSVERLLSDLDVPTETRNFPLRYIKAETLEPKIKPLVTPDTGSIHFDAVANRLVVTDTKRKLDVITKIIQGLDVRPAQVLIEALMIDVDLDDSSRYGIDWSIVINKVGSFDRVNVEPNFPVSAPSGGTLSTLTLGRGEDDIQATISILEKFGKTNVLSSPRITVVSDQEAKLAVATREPFVSQTVVQGANNSTTTADNVQFINVGVTLTVKPTIGEDEYIVLTVKPEVSTQGTPLELQGVATSSETAYVRTRVPVVTTQEFETVVTVKDGHTLVLGGLIQDSEAKAMQKIPFLGDLPFIGAGFRSKTNTFSKSELVVFLTPKIISPDSRTHEINMYVNEKGKLLPFNRVGGFPFDKGIYQSQGPFQSNDEPFWKRRPGDSPVWFRPDNLNSRDYDPYSPTFKTPGPGQAAAEPPAPQTDSAGQSTPGLETVSDLNMNKETADYHKTVEIELFQILIATDLGLKGRKGSVRVELVLLPNGRIKRLRIPQTDLVKEPETQKRIEEAILAFSPFPPFPPALSVPEEVFQVDFQLDFT